MPRRVTRLRPRKGGRTPRRVQTEVRQTTAFTVNLPSTPEFKAIGELAKGCGKWRRRHLEPDQSTLIVSATGDFEATGFITFGDPNIDQIFFGNDMLGSSVTSR
jgi:hypothetical protein